MLRHDTIPDACALRLKMLLSAPELKCPWRLEEEAATYAKLRGHTSAGCRLTIEDEMAVLQRCPPPATTAEMRNRRNFIEAVMQAPDRPVSPPASEDPL